MNVIGWYWVILRMLREASKEGLLPPFCSHICIFYIYKIYIMCMLEMLMYLLFIRAQRQEGLHTSHFGSDGRP